MEYQLQTVACIVIFLYSCTNFYTSGYRQCTIYSEVKQCYLINISFLKFTLEDIKPKIPHDHSLSSPEGMHHAARHDVNVIRKEC